MTPEQRFIDKVRISPDGCWIWVGASVGLEYDYGKFWLDGAYDKAHRASFRIFKGPIPPAMWVLHRCDVPRCVNPHHLFLGTRQDNVDDMMRKGRGGHSKNPQRGERSALAKLTPQQVLEIRQRNAAGESQGALAKEFSVGQPTIHKIIHKERWAHL